MYPFLLLRLYTYRAMETVGTLDKAASEGWTDQEIVERVKAGDTSLYELIMRRYNQRLYRVARAILRDDAEAEDVMQDAYVRSYQHLHQFAARAPFSAWLTSIAVHEALGRLRLRKRNPQLATIADRWHRDVNYCLLLDTDHHRITPVHEVPDFYSAYLWKCLWAKDTAPPGLPQLNDCYLIWEHTDLTKPGAIRYNLDSLRHKEEFLAREYGGMELLQKSGPLIDEKPSLTSATFQDLFGAIGRM